MIVLIPVKVYVEPTEALYESVRLEGVDEPKRVAREHIRKKLLKELQ